MIYPILSCKESRGRIKKGSTKYGLKLKKKWIQHVKDNPELWEQYDPNTGLHRNI